MLKLESVPENETHKILWESRPDDQMTRPGVKKKKTSSCLVDFAIPADHKVEMKENETLNKYLARGIEIL